MFTSNFARLSKLPAGLRPVAIAQGVPHWYKGDRDLRLAPSRAMLDTAKEGNAAEYDRQFFAQLSQLDARQMFEELGENAVLLCWESPNVRCHRRAVAEWLENALGIVITEYGFERSEILSYPNLPAKTAAKKTTKVGSPASRRRKA